MITINEYCLFEKKLFSLKGNNSDCANRLIESSFRASAGAGSFLYKLGLDALMIEVYYQQIHWIK